MNKNYITYVIISILILFILITSFVLFVEPNIDVLPNIGDTKKVITIDNKGLNVTYYGGDKLDLSLTYGNIFEKYIDIYNNNDEDVTYSIKYIDSNLSNADNIYSVYISYNDEEYIEGVKDVTLTINNSLIYNLLIKGHSKNSIKIVFKSNHENEPSIIKGKLQVSENISQLELFNNTINKINDALEYKVSTLNGIYEKGYYILDINTLTFVNDANVSGYILIDASDISDIKYIYTVYNDKYMVKNNNISNIDVINVDNEYVSTLNEQNLCHLYDTRINCSNFSNIKKSSIDDKREFFNATKDVINKVKELTTSLDDKTYIYNIREDIDNNSRVDGYILVNKENMYLYMKDDLFMISGYNYTKLGDYNIKSTTIRSYNESAWNLSSSDMNKVCSFSGFTECYNKEGNRV
jgi:hypothetical protein